MKKHIFILFQLLIIFLLLSCASSKYTISRYGDRASLIFNSGVEYECELINISDSVIIFTPLHTHPYSHLAKPQTIYYVKINELKSIEIEGLDGKNWMSSVLFTQVLPVGLLAISASSADADVGPVIAVFSIPAILTATFLAASNGETPRWESQDTTKTLDNLNKYTRYPIILKQEEINKLLKKRKQSELKPFKINENKIL